ncbi:hypothetical protein [Pseudolactococcus insecticola]|uniref:HTH cro/C1-type domain-containing protein n=1 Tax=Pseudolactococcus insecticola TaxID=2709158 RepID=A0A6A0B9C5_9LACT|nr:hypothetical protein [Lactococcus insecticola]GFH41061.1 hypothetical protein Hs20B_14590 [Lactococcus insecticola]
MKYMEQFNYLRKKKNLKLTYLDPVDMGRSRFYRLMSGEQLPTIADVTTLALFLNFTAFEGVTAFYERPSKADLLAPEHDTTYDIWDVASILEIILTATKNLRGHPTQANLAQSKMIFEKIKTNLATQKYFPTTIDLIDLITAEYEHKPDEADHFLTAIYDRLIKRDAWTTYEISIIAILATLRRVSDTSLFVNLSSNLDELMQIVADDHASMFLINNLKYSLFISAIYRRDHINIKKFYKSLQKERQSQQDTYLAFHQKFAEILYLELLGHPEDAEPLKTAFFSAVEVILDNHLLDKPNKTSFLEQYQHFSDFTNAWREDDCDGDSYANMLY